jgi:TetR/AcrR family transcriptional repressor of mexCD-oprJ operon
MTDGESLAPTTPRRRADAERSIARIMDAAVDALARDPEVSMAEIARQAEVVRATVYVHFPTRESLIEAVTERAISEVSAAIAEAEPARSDPVDALRRVVATTWEKLGRYHPLVAINTQLPRAELRHRHASVLGALEPLIERGQKEGAFRADVPVAWHLSMLLALIHAASAEVEAGRLPIEEAESAVAKTVLGALAEPSRYLT